MLKSSTCILLLFSFLLVNEPAQARDKIDASGWQLERQNGLGREIIYANQNGVKITYPVIGLNILSKPPSWDVIWFNTKSHQQFSETVSHYRIRKGFSAAPSPAPKLSQMPSTYAGIKCRVIKVNENEGRETSNLGFVPRVEGSPKLVVIQSHYYVSEPTNLPAGALEFLSTFFGMPNFGGIPLACHNKLQTGAEKRIWYTLTVQRKQLSSETFAGPIGYAKVVSPTQLSNGGFTSKIEDLAKDLKLGEEFGK